jgi:hypothetical protein
MRRVLIVAVAMSASSAAVAADYHAQYREPRVISSREYAAPMYAPYVPPMYYLPSPPQYVQDLRTGAPGRWVQLQPTFLDQLFGRGDGY